MTDNPQGESVPTTDDQAADYVSRMMTEPEKEPEKEPEAPTVAEEDPEANQEEPMDDEPEPVEELAVSDEEEDAEPLPDTVDGLAEALGVSPDDLANHLKLNVTVNGETREVTLAEARKGQQLDSDYRQKTMELSEQRKALEASQQQEAERWQQRVAQLDDVLAIANQVVPLASPEEMARLLEEDPYEYVKVKAREDEKKNALAQMVAERDKHHQEAIQQSNKTQQEYRVEQQRLLASAYPDVKDAEKLKKFEGNASGYLKRMGYTDEEVSQAFTMYDHRNILMLKDAIAYDAMKKGNVGKKLKSLPKIQKPGTPAEKPNKLTASKDRLSKLKTRGTKQEQTAAAVDFVESLLR